jgi:hypothetical protein
MPRPKVDIGDRAGDAACRRVDLEPFADSSMVRAGPAPRFAKAVRAVFAFGRCSRGDRRAFLGATDRVPSGVDVGSVRAFGGRSGWLGFGFFRFAFWFFGRGRVCLSGWLAVHLSGVEGEPYDRGFPTNAACRAAPGATGHFIRLACRLARRPDDVVPGFATFGVDLAGEGAEDVVGESARRSRSNADVLVAGRIPHVRRVRLGGLRC